MRDMAAGLAVLGVPAVATLAEAVSATGLSTLEGWTATGLLAAVLFWVLNQHLPRKDKEMNELAVRKDDQLAALLTRHEHQLEQQSSQFQASLKHVTDHCKEEMQEMVNHLKEELRK
jgi:DNA anti-recombination protein RmuC